MRLNLTLDDDHAAKLEVLAQRSHVKPGTLARPLLLSVIDEVAVATQAGDSISLNEL
jgi:hypothetical protein